MQSLPCGSNIILSSPLTCIPRESPTEICLEFLPEQREAKSQGVVRTLQHFIHNKIFMYQSSKDILNGIVITPCSAVAVGFKATKERI